MDYTHGESLRLDAGWAYDIEKHDFVRRTLAKRAQSFGTFVTNLKIYIFECPVDPSCQEEDRSAHAHAFWRAYII